MEGRSTVDLQIPDKALSVELVRIILEAVYPSNYHFFLQALTAAPHANPSPASQMSDGS